MRSLILILSVILALALVAMIGHARAEGGKESEGSIEAVLASNPYDVRDEVNDWCYVTMDGFVNIGEPGNPDLPVKTYKFILPPTADLESVEIEVLDIQSKSLEGGYDVSPGGPFFLTSDPETLKWGEGKTIVDSKNMKIYGKDALYPSEPITLLGTARMRKWKLAFVRFTPIRYNPVQKTLSLIETVSIRIKFEKEIKSLPSKIKNE
jgi:hypothetical protein